MYGNTDEDEPEAYRVFPYIMSRLNPFFSYKSSRFVVQKSKASTARITMWKELGIPGVYTIEASFFGPTSGGTVDGHFSTAQLSDMGRSVCQALTIYGNLLRPVAADTAANNNRQSEVERKVREDLRLHKDLLLLRDQDETRSDEGSDSNPSEDNMDPKEVVQLVSAPDKKEMSNGNGGVAGDAKRDKESDTEIVITDATFISELAGTKDGAKDIAAATGEEIKSEYGGHSPLSRNPVAVLTTSTRGNKATARTQDERHRTPLRADTTLLRNVERPIPLALLGLEGGKHDFARTIALPVRTEAAAKYHQIPGEKKLAPLPGSIRSRVVGRKCIGRTLVPQREHKIVQYVEIADCAAQTSFAPVPQYEFQPNARAVGQPRGSRCSKTTWEQIRWIRDAVLFPRKTSQSFG